MGVSFSPAPFLQAPRRIQQDIQVRPSKFISIGCLLRDRLSPDDHNHIADDVLGPLCAIDVGSPFFKGIKQIDPKPIQGAISLVVVVCNELKALCRRKDLVLKVVGGQETADVASCTNDYDIHRVESQQDLTLDLNDVCPVNYRIG